MKRLIAIIISCLVSSLASAIDCQEDIQIKFKNTWHEYYSAALVKDGKTMEKYFNFPLKLNAVFDGEKPLTISKKYFIKNYSLIFIKNKVTKNTDFFNEFQKSKSDSLDSQDIAGIKRFCNGASNLGVKPRLGNIVFDWFPKTGWKITEIYYSTDDRNFLLDSVNYPDMEYAFP